MLVEEFSGLKRNTVGADKAYNTRDFVNGPSHRMWHKIRLIAAALSTDGTVRTGGYSVSQHVRKREESLPRPTD